MYSNIKLNMILNKLKKISLVTANNDTLIIDEHWLYELQDILKSIDYKTIADEDELDSYWEAFSNFKISKNEYQDENSEGVKRYHQLLSDFVEAAIRILMELPDITSRTISQSSEQDEISNKHNLLASVNLRKQSYVYFEDNKPQLLYFGNTNKLTIYNNGATLQPEINIYSKELTRLINDEMSVTVNNENIETQPKNRFYIN